MNTKMSLYEYSKQVVAMEKPMDPIVYNKKTEEISEDIMKNEYSMLLCNDRRDFTLFHYPNISSNSYCRNDVAKELKEILNERGTILLMDKQIDGAWEIWIRDFNTEENYAYYLFDYTKGVVELS